MTSPTPSARQALIVAHGQPSDPEGPEAEIAALARRVGGHLPGWTVRGTTLAMPGGIARAARGMAGPLVFPFFMADGWFIRTLLPERLAQAGLAGARVLTPFGLLPETEALAIRVVDEALAARGWRAGEVTLVLAAHGSGRSRKPAEAAGAMRAALAGARAFAEVRLGFIEEPPFVAEALARAGGRAILLPLFVARWGHVGTDLPEAVAQSGFPGPVLAPLGTDAAVAGIVAGAIAAG
ncbi:MAG: sirohydrochlorin chelatase [Paracoccaceae bacterium]